MLKILSIGSDRKLFEEGSAVSRRIKEYGALVDELHIVVFTLKSLGFKEKRLAQNIWIYPTNSLSRWLYVRDAFISSQRIIMERKLKQGNYLITTQDPFESGLVGLKLKKKYRVPLEVQLHTDPFSPYFSGSLNMIRRYITKRVFKSADSIRVVRPKLRTKIIEKFGVSGGRISVLPIYIDERRFNSEPKFNLHKKYDADKIVLSTSRLSKEKNLPIIIKAMLKVEDAVLVIVGSGPEEKNLKKLVKEVGLDEKIKFEGWQEELSSYYKTADILVQASSFEGYGLSIVEAGMCGLPVVSTPTGISEDLDEVSKAEDVNSFAQRINYLLDNKSERKRLGNNLKDALKTTIYTRGAYLQALKSNWERLLKDRLE